MTFPIIHILLTGCLDTLHTHIGVGLFPRHFLLQIFYYLFFSTLPTSSPLSLPTHHHYFSIIHSYFDHSSEEILEEDSLQCQSPDPSQRKEIPKAMMSRHSNDKNVTKLLIRLRDLETMSKGYEERKKTIKRAKGKFIVVKKKC
jgi:hypothetical protein